MTDTIADFGSVYSSRVNAVMAKLKIKYASFISEFLLLQDVRETQSGTEYREPTTSAGPVYYSGQPNNRIQGTALFTTDLYKASTSNISILNTRINGEKPVFKLSIQYTDSQATPVTDTFTYDPSPSFTAWSSSSSYLSGNPVSYSGGSYLCISPIGPTNTTPNNDTSHWMTYNGGAKFESCIRQKSPEGAVKIDMSIVLIGDPVIS